MKITRLLLVSITVAASAFAQLDQGQISGTIQDSSNARVSRAQVTIASKATKAVRSATTDSDGLFSITNLPVGFYDIEVTASGFKASRQTDVKVAAAARVTADFLLELGSLTETVTVEASTAQFRRTRP